PPDYGVTAAGRSLFHARDACTPWVNVLSVTVSGRRNGLGLRGFLRQPREVELRFPDVGAAEDPGDPARILRWRARVPGGDTGRAADVRHAGVRGVARARQLAPLDDPDRASLEVARDLVQRRALVHFGAEDVLARDDEQAPLPVEGHGPVEADAV